MVFISWNLPATIARENIDGTPLLKLLYQTLRVLCRKIIDFKLVRRIYELKVFVLEGEYPQCFSWLSVRQQ